MCFRMLQWQRSIEGLPWRGAIAEIPSAGAEL
jgi:hypothetical protein